MHKGRATQQRPRACLCACNHMLRRPDTVRGQATSCSSCWAPAQSSFTEREREREKESKQKLERANSGAHCTVELNRPPSWLLLLLHVIVDGLSAFCHLQQQQQRQQLLLVLIPQTASAHDFIQWPQYCHGRTRIQSGPSEWPLLAGSRDNTGQRDSRSASEHIYRRFLKKFSQ